MIEYFRLDLNQISKNWRDYGWPRPDRCGSCGHKPVWCHDFVRVIFQGFTEALYMRRYRCPECGCIIRLRPEGYFKRHQSDTGTIRSTLSQRLATGRWPCGCVANRARHWLAGLKRHALALLGLPAMADLMAAFDRLVCMGRVPVSRAV